MFFPSKEFLSVTLILLVVKFTRPDPWVFPFKLPNFFLFVSVIKEARSSER